MTYKESFISFMIESKVLTFGEFKLKSGRLSPYFINCGAYRSGGQLLRLGEYYAECIEAHHLAADTLFGPAYKGIPLACAAAMGLSQKYHRDVYYCADRKEVKDHGEGGMFIGKTPEDGERVLLIDDVITSGKALSESLPKLLGAAKVDIAGMVVTVDRQERGTGEHSAVQEVKEKFGLTVYPIVTMEDIMTAMREEVVPGKEYLPQMIAYREEYGV